MWTFERSFTGFGECFDEFTLQDRLSITAKATVIELLGQDQRLEISQLDRYKEGKLLIQDCSVRFMDNVALFGMLDEVFVRENYKFNCEKGDSEGQAAFFYWSCSTKRRSCGRSHRAVLPRFGVTLHLSHASLLFGRAIV
jgi:hypothetical protein